MTGYVVASANIRHALPAAKFAEDVSTVLGVPGLDLAGFQECSGADRRRALDTLSDRYGVGLTNLDPYQTPVVRSARFVLVEEFRWHLTRRTKVGPAGAGPRFMSAKWAVVQVLTDGLTGRTVAHANAHLVPSIFLPIRRRLHRRQVARLAELTTHLLTTYPGARVFLGGDFNATPTKPRGWADPLRAAGLVHGGRSTIPTHESGRTIDHIFSTVPLTSSRVLRDVNTDHWPLVATFETKDEPMPKGFCPFATVRNIPPGVNDPPITPRLAILHVDAGNAETLYDYFRDRSGGVESHFFVKKSGEIEQYRSIYWQADANLEANGYAVSIETQGYGAGEWTDAQLAGIKRLLTWLNTEADIPLRKVQRPEGSGVGYHVMFGAPGPWTPVAKTCPGPERIVQFEEILVPWMRKQSKPPGPNRVEQAHALLAQAYDLLDEVPEQRVRVKAVMDDLAVLIDRLPEK